MSYARDYNQYSLWQGGFIFASQRAKDRLTCQADSLRCCLGTACQTPSKANRFAIAWQEPHPESQIALPPLPPLLPLLLSTPDHYEYAIKTASARPEDVCNTKAICRPINAAEERVADGEGLNRSRTRRQCKQVRRESRLERNREGESKKQREREREVDSASEREGERGLTKPAADRGRSRSARSPRSAPERSRVRATCFSCVQTL